MGCCGSKKNKSKLQEHEIVDERTEFNFGLVNTQSNTESEGKGIGVVEIIEIISFAAIFILKPRGAFCVVKKCNSEAIQRGRIQNILTGNWFWR